MQSSPNAHSACILALDVEHKSQAFAVLRTLGAAIQWVKVGLQLFCKHGPAVVEALSELGYKVFLDLKLHDIPNTVASAIRSLKGLPVGILTIHCSGGATMLQRAIEAQREALPSALLVGVTVLTSTNHEALKAIGIEGSLEDQVLRLAQLGCQAGLGGLVCSPLELPLLRCALPPNVTLITPGIRSTKATGDDQQRTLTARQAIAAGASYIVVGRPILQAVDPLAALNGIFS